jgi:gamma-glutamylcyclotransferase (GGCT)/AIG2-like uncharacterized protein YtfP
LSSAHLFVYGTLRRGFNNRYARLLDRSAKYLGTALIRGRLYDLGRYPGIRLQAIGDEWVAGEIYCLRNAALTLAVLDEYEGSAFERVEANALLSDRVRLSCWVYEYKRRVTEGKRVISGDWLESRYIATRVPSSTLTGGL